MDQPSSELPSEKAVTNTRTEWHRILGAVLELLLSRLDITVQTEVPVMSDPPKVDILLLRRQGDRWTQEQMSMLCDGLRDTQATHLLVEFKYVESFNEEALLQVLGYYYFYRLAQELREDELQVFVMVAQTPRRKVLDRFGFEGSERPGVYFSQQPLASRVQLIVLNQLQASLHNAFVQCFASQRRVYQSAFERIRQLNYEHLSERLWNLVAGLREQRDRKRGEMTKKPQEENLTPEYLMQIGEETRKFILATSSIEERLADLAPEEMDQLIKKLPPQKRVAGLAPEERLAGLAPEERLAGLAPEEMAKLMEQIENYLHRSSTSDK